MPSTDFLTVLDIHGRRGLVCMTNVGAMFPTKSGGVVFDLGGSQVETIEPTWDQLMEKLALGSEKIA